jgi:hypothetical protein
MTKQKTTIQLHEKKLPTIQELYENTDLAIKHDDLAVLLNQNPPQSWVKRHPYIKDHDYLPIDKVEWLLRRIFKQYRIEITGQGVAFNGVWVTVRVHYKHPVTNEWEYHDGIGAMQLQTAKGTSPADLANINNGALSMAFPICKTLAIKDACDMFGSAFGANLNRRDVIPYSQDEKLQDVKREKEIDRLRRLIEAAEQEQDLVNLAEHVEAMGDDELNELFAEKQKSFEVEEGGEDGNT